MPVNAAYKAIIRLLVLCLLCSSRLGLAQETVPFRTTQETFVARFDPDHLIKESLTVSPDGRRIAYIEEFEGKQYIVVDGKDRGRYDEISGYPWGLCFSPDSKRLAYYGRVGVDWSAVVDGEPIKGFGPVVNSLERFEFSPDGKRIAFKAISGKKVFNVIDGKSEEPFDSVGRVVFSPDSKRTAYTATLGSKSSIVVDGKKGKEYGIVGNPEFGPDSRRLAYKAYPEKAWTKRSQRWFEVIDEEKGKTYWMIWDFNLFSQDGKRTVYSANSGQEAGTKSVIVIDGKEIAEPGTDLQEPLFSPDSKHFAYMARKEREAYNVIDGTPGRTYALVSVPVFSPDSSRVAYYAKAGSKHFVVVNGAEGMLYDEVGHPVFSSDSKKVAYAAKEKGRWFMVVDDKVGKDYDYVSKPTLSPDGTKVAYVARIKNKECLVAGDNEGDWYDKIYPKHWRARVSDSGVGFSSRDSFYYFAQAGNKLYFVEETVR